MNYPDVSTRHLQFIYHSLLSMNDILKEVDRKVYICQAEALNVFQYLNDNFKINQIFSHEENGTQITWNRDKKVSGFCKSNHIEWLQSQRDGVIRGIKNRDNWDQAWRAKMHGEIIRNQYSNSNLDLCLELFALTDEFRNQMEYYPSQFQPAGEWNAWRYIKSFAAGRGFNYHRHISKPSKSRVSCSRISPYLAWGNMSIRQVFQFVGTHPNGTANDRAFSGMLTRLHWHCHFIQKFEVECEYETLCINRGFELLSHEKNEEYIKAWEKGMTGIPIIDACMRAVTNTGWINFRMRAMVVSFLTLNLDQDWRNGTYFLARQFLDYEPGIHYPQFQMQSGTTGVNTVRLYNPVKNSQEHDPDGVFIKKWMPELQNVPLAHIHEPWKMTQMEQTFCGVVIGKDYPSPIVDLQESARAARDKIWAHREHPEVKDERYRILATHVRKEGNKRSKTNR